MKLHLLAFVSVASATALVSAQGGSDREREGLVGAVRAVRSEYVRVMGAGSGSRADGPPTPLGSVSYDAAGNYAVREVIDDYGFPVGKESFSYTQGRLTGSRLVDPKGRVLESRAYAYGAASSYERVTITDQSGRAYDERYTRGPGNRIDAIRYVSGTREGEEARTDGPMNTLIRFAYRYDDRGNWIQRTETIRYDVGRAMEPSTPLVRVTTRTITYF